MPSDVLQRVSNWDSNVHSYHQEINCVPEIDKYIKQLSSSYQYFGIELEYIIKTTKRDKFRAITDGFLKYFDSSIDDATYYRKKTLVMLKEDGSVYNSRYVGIELVTAPMNYDTLINDFELFFNKFKPYILVANNTGMHIHVSRSSFEPLQIKYLEIFLNASENRQFLYQIAGRKNNDYARYKLKTIKNIAEENSDRYRCLNLSNKNTIEFRFFKAPCNYQEFFNRLIFTTILCDYVKAANIAELHYKDFLVYLKGCYKCIELSAGHFSNYMRNAKNYFDSIS